MTVGVKLLSAVVFIACCACGGGRNSCDNVAAVHLSEVMLDPEGDDTGKQFIEIVNGSTLAARFQSLWFGFGESAVERSIRLPEVELAPNQIAVFGKEKIAVSSDSVSVAVKNFPSMSHAVRRMTLSCSRALVDSVELDTAPQSGISSMRSDAPEEGTEGAQTWCNSPHQSAYDGTNVGTPGEKNGVCPLSAPPGFCFESGQLRPVVKPRAQELLVSEVMASPSAPSSSHGEWIELYASASVDLNGLTVVVGSGRGTVESVQCVRVEAKQFVVLRSATSTNALSDAWPVKMTLSNDGAQGVLSSDDVLIDRFQFGKSKRGVALQIENIEGAIDTSNDSADGFCDATQAVPGFDERGTPGKSNTGCQKMNDDSSGWCVDSSTEQRRKVNVVAEGDVVFSELMIDPRAVSDDQGEYVELHVLRDVDLNGLTLTVGAASLNLFDDAHCRRATAGDFIVLARSADGAKNGGLERVDQTFSTPLPNAVASPPHQLSLKREHILIDTVELANADRPAIAGASWQRVGPDDAQPDAGVSWCLAPGSARYGTNANSDRGTPGQVNRCDD
jgi:hypothetical protein